jgi:hypothetical protein
MLLQKKAFAGFAQSFLPSGYSNVRLGDIHSHKKDTRILLDPDTTFFTNQSNLLKYEKKSKTRPELPGKFLWPFEPEF